MCGLKFVLQSPSLRCSLVTPHVGVWIEITMVRVMYVGLLVTPHVGVWIEIINLIFNVPFHESHLT